VIGAISAIHANQRIEAANEQTGADRQHHRERHFSHEKGVASSPLLPPSCYASSCGESVGPRRGATRRNEAARNRCEQNNRQGKSQRPCIDSHFVDARKSGRTHATDDSCAPIGQRHTGRTTSKSDYQRFGQHMTHHTTAPGAERGAKNEFAPSPRGAG
jgi:hypothetical protein